MLVRSGAKSTWSVDAVNLFRPALHKGPSDCSYQSLRPLFVSSPPAWCFPWSNTTLAYTAVLVDCGHSGTIDKSLSMVAKLFDLSISLPVEPSLNQLILGVAFKYLALKLGWSRVWWEELVGRSSRQPSASCSLLSCSSPWGITLGLSAFSWQ